MGVFAVFVFLCVHLVGDSTSVYLTLWSLTPVCLFNSFYLSSTLEIKVSVFFMIPTGFSIFMVSLQYY